MRKLSFGSNKHEQGVVIEVMRMISYRSKERKVKSNTVSEKERERTRGGKV